MIPLLRFLVNIGLHQLMYGGRGLVMFPSYHPYPPIRNDVLSCGFRFVAEEWKKLPFAQKQRYEDLEEKDRRRYHAEMAVFNEALELGIVDELPGSGGDVNCTESERHMEQKAAGSIHPFLPQWVRKKAAQVSVAAVGRGVGLLDAHTAANSFPILFTYLHRPTYDYVAMPLPCGTSLPSSLVLRSSLTYNNPTDLVSPQDGAVRDAAPGDTPWAETPTSRSCGTNPER